MKLITRAIVPLLLVFAVVAVGLASGDKPYAGTTITLIGLASPPLDMVKNVFVPRFEEETGIKVIVDDFPYLAVREKQLVELTARTGSYDIIMFDLVWLGEYSRFLLPLGDRIEEASDELAVNDILPSMLENYAVWDGTFYGVPGIHPGVSMLYYRTDLFNDPENQQAFKEIYGSELAVPTTWEEFYDVAEFFATQVPDVYGFASAYIRGEHIVCDFLTRLWGLGGEFIDERTWRPMFNSANGVKALNFYKDMIKFGPPGLTSYAHDETSTAMLEGNVAMIIQWTGYAPAMEDPSQSSVAGKVGYAVVPGKRPTLGGWSSGICVDSKNKDAAWEFIKWFNSKDLAKEIAMAGGGVVRPSIFTDPDVLAKYPHLASDLDSYRYSFRRPPIPEWPKLSEIFGLYLSEAVAGSKSVEEALDTAAAEMEALLRAAGYYD